MYFKYIFTVLANPIDVTENLFFAIFGQKDTDDFIFAGNRQPLWTKYLFKVLLLLSY